MDMWTWAAACWLGIPLDVVERLTMTSIEVNTLDDVAYHTRDVLSFVPAPTWLKVTPQYYVPANQRQVADGYLIEWSFD